MIKYYTVYKVTNTINSKVYIGTHKTNDLNDDYMGSGKYLKYSQNKHGMENFEKEILHVFDNPEEMFAKENELVNEEFIAETNTYNLKIGGCGGWEYNNTPVGQTLRAHAYAKWQQAGVAAHMLKYEHDEEYRNAQKAHMKSIQMSGVLQMQLNNPNGTFHGKTHTDETKHKMSETAKERLKDPTNNSQYGSMWIYSIEEQRSIKIKKDDPIPEGWLKGRKMKFS
jgi:hypothetical protein